MLDGGCFQRCGEDERGVQTLLRLTEPRAGRRVCDPQQGWQRMVRGRIPERTGFQTLLRLTEPRAGRRVCDPQQGWQ